MYYNKKVLKLQLINFGLMVLSGIVCCFTNVSANKAWAVMLIFLALQGLIWAYNYRKLREKIHSNIYIVCSISVIVISILFFVKK